MKLKTIIDELGLCEVFLTGEKAGGLDVRSVYCGDLLSDVLAHVQSQAIWFTIQAHVSIIAVAHLREIACVVITNGVAPDPQTIAKARDQGVNLCSSTESSAGLCMKLAGKL